MTHPEAAHTAEQASKTNTAMTTGELLIRWDVAEVWNAGDLAVVDDLFAADFVLHDPLTPDEVRGPDGFRDVITIFRTAFPDLEMQIDDLVAAGDRVAFRWTFRGTHRGDLLGVPPTGKSVEITGIDLCRIEDEKIAEIWASMDALGLLDQLGLQFPQILVQLPRIAFWKLRTGLGWHRAC